MINHCLMVRRVTIKKYVYTSKEGINKGTEMQQTAVHYSWYVQVVCTGGMYISVAFVMPLLAGTNFVSSL